MPRWSGKQTDTGIPVTIERDRYVEGDVDATIEGNVVLGEKLGNTLFPIQLDATGYLKVVSSGGDWVAGTEYSDGDINTASKGVLSMGDDGTNLQNVNVDADGRLQVEVVEGQYDGVQYQDGAAIASPFGTVALGHDGSNVFPVVIDSDGYLQVDIHDLPTNISAVEGSALGKGVLVQGDDGTDRHNVTVDVDGNVQVDIVASLPAGSAAIGKLAANSGIDIGDVDVLSLPALVAGDNNIGNVDIVSEPKVPYLNSMSDITLVATSTTQIVGALTTRLSALIGNKGTNVQIFRIGDLNVGASRGAELAPGESISIETTEAIYGYNPGGSGEDVSVRLDGEDYITEPPAAPTLISPTNGSTVSNTSITFQWNSVPSASNYQIRVSTDPAVETDLFHEDTTGGATSKNYTDFPNDETTYYWKVRAYNTSGWGDWSTIWNFINGDDGVPVVESGVMYYYDLQPGTVMYFKFEGYVPDSNHPIQVSMTPQAGEPPTVDMLIRKHRKPVLPDDRDLAYSGGNCSKWDSEFGWYPVKPPGAEELYYCLTGGVGQPEFVEIHKPMELATFYILWYNWGDEKVRNQRLIATYY